MVGLNSTEPRRPFTEMCDPTMQVVIRVIDSYSWCEN